MNEALQAEHDRLTAYLNDTSTLGTPERRKVILTHRAVTDFLHGDVTIEALRDRVKQIEAGQAE